MLLIEFWSSATPRSLEAICEGLVRQNVEQLEVAARRGQRLPRLYDSGAVYRRDPPGREWFRSASRVLRPQPSWCGDDACGQCRGSRGLLGLCGPRLRWFDCDDGAALVAAEHRHYHRRRSRVAVVQTSTPGLLHAIVQHPDGALEDPTALVRSRTT